MKTAQDIIDEVDPTKYYCYKYRQYRNIVDMPPGQILSCTNANFTILVCFACINCLQMLRDKKLALEPIQDT